MKQAQPYVTLSDGNKIPQIGLGTALIKDQEGKKAIKTAIMEVGYRHIDTAKLYQNEEIIGEILGECFMEGLKREDIFITSKLWISEMADPEKGLKESLTKLKLEYLDLYLIHYPLTPFVKGEFARIPLFKTWKVMEELVKGGLVKSIGISNFNVQLTLDLLSYAEIKPVVNQIELHPYFSQYSAVEWYKKMGIQVQAYSPLLAPNKKLRYQRDDTKSLFEEPVIAALAEKYKRTKGQVILNWGIQRGHIIIPKSSNKMRQIENLECYDFKLEAEEMEKMNSLECGQRSHNMKYSENEGSVPLFE